MSDHISAENQPSFNNLLPYFDGLLQSMLSNSDTVAEALDTEQTLSGTIILFIYFMPAGGCIILYILPGILRK